MKKDEEDLGPDPSQPRDRQRQWLIAGAVLLAMVGAGWKVARSGLAAVPQRPLDGELIEAVKRGDAVAVTRLLNQGASPNAREVVLTKPSLSEGSEGGQPALEDTALILAARGGNLQIAKLLLREGADVNARGVAGYTSLIEAVRSGRVEMAKFLLEHGARPNREMPPMTLRSCLPRTWATPN